MDISEKDLYTLVEKIIKQLLPQGTSNQASGPKSKIYYVLAGDRKDWDFSFFERLKDQRQHEIFVVLPPSLDNDDLSKLKQYQQFGTILRQNEIDLDESTDYLTVFPFVPRDLVVKSALCIGDTFETRWIQKCISNGRKIILLKSGIEKFTGKEPRAYVNKIQEYYKTISTYGIEIKDDIFERETPTTAPVIKPSISPARADVAKGERQLITTVELEQYAENKKIVLHQGDMITALAEERAEELGIEIVRAY